MTAFPALILEGGGMRGAFTAGVLDYWLDHGQMFNDVYGVSAGACQACSYLCGQRGRAIRIWTKYCADKRFCSFSSLIRTGDFFNADFNYHQLPERLEPIDNDFFLRSGSRFFSVATDLENGRPAYLQIKDMKKDVIAVQASSSLPLLSKPVVINGRKYLDGGVSDSVPLTRAIQDGYQKQVLVLTQPVGFRKTANRALPLIKRLYKAYPAFVKVMEDRHIMYNQTLDEIAEMEKRGAIFVIRPASLCGVGRIERDPQKLQALYASGYETAKVTYGAMMKYLNEPLCE